MKSGAESIKKPVYQHLFELGNALLKEKDMNELLNSAMRTVIEISGAERGWMMLFKEYTQEIEYQTLKNLREIDIEDSKFEFSRIIIEQVKTEAIPMYLPRAHNDSAPDPKNNMKASKTLSVICFPLIHDGHFLGVLYLDHEQAKERFTQEIFDLVQEHSQFIATAVYSLSEQDQIRNLISNFEKSNKDLE